MPTTTHATAVSTLSIPTVMPATTSTPITMSMPITPPVLLFHFLNGNHLLLPALIPKTLQLSACISQIISHWPRWHNLPQPNILHSLLVMENKDDCENLPEFGATFPDWDVFNMLSSGSIQFQESLHIIG